MISNPCRHSVFVVAVLAACGMKDAQADLGILAGPLLPSPAPPGSGFGNDVAIYGITAVVGAPFESTDEANGGAAYVWRHDGSQWVFRQRLTAPDPVIGAAFGHSIDLSGNWLAISEPSPLEAGVAETVRMFRYETNLLSWVYQQTLTPGDGPADREFGWSVVLDGEVLAVGAPNDDDAGTNAGAIYVFRLTGNVWTEEQKLLASDAALNDNLGEVLAVSSATIVAGVPTRNGPPPGVGAAYGFRYNGATWAEQQQFVPPTVTSAFLGFGSSVSAIGDVIAIGIPGYDTDAGGPGGNNAGAVNIYRYSGISSTWELEQVIVHSFNNLHLGRTVVLGTNRLAARGDTAHIFELDQGTWTLSGTLLAGDNSPPGLDVGDTLDMDQRIISGGGDVAYTFDLQANWVDQNLVLVGGAFPSFDLFNLRTGETFRGLCIEDGEFLESLSEYADVPLTDAPTSTPHTTPAMADLAAEYWEEYWPEDHPGNNPGVFRQGVMELVIDQNDGPSAGQVQGTATSPPYTWLSSLDGMGPRACLRALVVCGHQDFLYEVIHCATDGDCNDGIDGNVDSCGAGGCCVFTPNAVCCDNRNSCDGLETCVSGGCQPGTTEPAGTPCSSPLFNECDEPDTCDGVGNCAPNNIAGPCSSDGLLCTQDVCAGGVCTHTQHLCPAALCALTSCEESSAACQFNGSPGLYDSDTGCCSINMDSLPCQVPLDCPAGTACVDGTCSCPAECGPCRPYMDLEPYWCLVDVGDVGKALEAYAEADVCSTTTSAGVTPGSQVWDGGCPQPCNQDAECVSGLGAGKCVLGLCCDLCELSEIIQALDMYIDIDTPACPYGCPPGACELPPQPGYPMGCCRDSAYFDSAQQEQGTALSDCLALGGTFLGLGVRCATASALPVCNTP